VPMLVLETALPIKFSATLIEALGREPECPAQFAGLQQLPLRVTLLPAQVQAVQAYVARHCV
jgi:threonine synthase